MKYLWILFLILLVVSDIVCAQNPGSKDDIVSDTAEVNRLLGLVNVYSRKNPRIAKIYANEAISVAQTNENKPGHVRALLYLGQVYAYENKYVIAKRYYFSALRFAEEYGLKKDIPVCLGSLGIICERQSRFDESIVLYKKCEDAFALVGDTAGIIRSKINLSNVYKLTGKTSEAVSIILESLPWAEKMNDPKILSALLNNLSILYIDVGKNNEALKYLEEAKELAINCLDSTGIANCYSNIGMIYQNTGRKSQAEQCYLSAAAIRQTQKDKIGFAIALNNLGSLKYDDQKFPEAFNYFNKAFEIAREIDERQSMSKYLKNCSDALAGMKRFPEAISCLEQSLTIAQEYGLSIEKLSALFAFSEIYSKMDQDKNALEYYKRYNAFNDSLKIDQNKQAVEELKTRYESDKKEQLIRLLEEEKRAANFKSLVFIILSFLLILSILFVYYIQRSRMRRNKEISVFMNSLMEEKLRVSELEQDNLRQELNFKGKEITNMALYLVQKTEFLESLNKEFKLLQKEKGSSSSEVIAKLSFLIANNLKLDKERIDIQAHIEKANLNFYMALCQSYPNITENEKKLCALLRMNLTSKDIASIYNISPASVDMNRYRLRKKLGLNPEENLIEYLNRFQ